MVDGMASIFFRVYFGSASDTNFIMPGTAFSYHIIHEIKNHLAFVYLAFLSFTRNGGPTQAKCSCFIGPDALDPGGQGTRHLCLITYFRMSINTSHIKDQTSIAKNEVVLKRF